MKDKKNIDRLFQEKFKDFEVAPPDLIWHNLETQLEEKQKKRRVIPFWFKLSGVAAIFIIGMFLSLPFINSDDNNMNSNPVVFEHGDTNPDGSIRIKPTDHPVKQRQPATGTAVAAGDEASQRASSGKAGEKSTLKINISTSNLRKTTDDVAYEGKDQPKDEKQLKRNSIHNRATTIIVQKDALAGNTGTNRNKRSRKASSGNTISNSGSTINFENSNDAIAPAASGDGIAAITNKTEPGRNSTNKNNVVQPEAAGENNKVVIPEDIISQEAVAQTGKPADSATTVAPENELEKLLREKLEGKDKEKTEVADAHEQHRWNVKPQMAPLFFNTASQGSPINANLAANSKDFDNDLSYGVGLKYELTDRISIRSGINTVNMRYSTNNVEYYAALDAPTNAHAIIPESGNASLIVGSPNPAGSVETHEVHAETYSGSLVQKMGFVEVPLEMSYKLINHKFGIDVIGGVSTLFLNNNNVTLLSEQGFSSSMGQADNINKVSFSTNVGVGFKYRFFESFEASFEPMFKYQLNTFSNNNGNFKPYFIGLYSGISFSF